MISIEKIQQLQEKSINIWPPKNYYFYNGWILRLAEGVTQRANSILPLRYLGSDMNRDLTIVEEIYQKMNLKPKFMMHDGFQPKNLQQVLKSRNYVSNDYSIVMGGKISTFNKIEPINKEFKINNSNIKSEEWKDFKSNFSHRSEVDKIHINKPEERVLPVLEKRFFSVTEKTEENKIIAIVLTFLDKQGYLHVVDLFVDKNYRRKGIASGLLYEILNKVKNKDIFLWLQVLRDNESAISLYSKIGLKKLYNYHYMTKTS